MANWCWNNVNFTGDEAQIAQVEALFTAMAKRERETGCGQLPPFADEENAGWFFETYWNEGLLSYQTKWSPNTERLIEIADHFSVAFVHNYEETGNGIYGEATYQDGRLSMVDLDDHDLERYSYDEDLERYLFEGEAYDGDWEILEQLLDEKKAAVHSATQPKR